MMRTDDGITAAERTALRTVLGIDDARITQAVAWARRAGYERNEFASVILDAATRSTKGKPGPGPRDGLRAAIYQGSPLDVDRAARFFTATMARAGAFGADAPASWADFAARRRPLSIHELAMECVADAVDRAAITAGQGSFAGVGWALPNFDAEEAVERDEVPEGEFE
jgi:hypothetical protein